MSRIKQLLSEPLVHFLLIGAVLFLAFDFTRDKEEVDRNVILVEAGRVDQLAAQFQNAWMRAPTTEELNRLVEGYVRDEVFYREAVAMGLDQDDPQVRRRLRLKLEFLLEDLTAMVPPDDEALTAYLQQNPDQFRLEPRISFRQVYLNPDRVRDLDAEAAALLARLNAGEDPDTLGDRTLQERDFVLVTPSDITRTFGEEFAVEMARSVPGDWTGPLFSGLGWHLVQVTEFVEGRLAALPEVRSQVLREIEAQRKQEMKDVTYATLREGYVVVIEEPVAQAVSGGEEPATAQSAAESK